MLVEDRGDGPSLSDHEYERSFERMSSEMGRWAHDNGFVGHEWESRREGGSDYHLMDNTEAASRSRRSGYADFTDRLRCRWGTYDVLEKDIVKEFAGHYTGEAAAEYAGMAVAEILTDAIAVATGNPEAVPFVHEFAPVAVGFITEKSSKGRQRIPTRIRSVKSARIGALKDTSMYRLRRRHSPDKDESEEPVPPALLCMALLLRGYHRMSDAQAVDLTVGSPLADGPRLRRHRWTSFRSGNASGISRAPHRGRSERGLLERTIELARQTTEFDWKKLPKGSSLRDRLPPC